MEHIDEMSVVKWYMYGNVTAWINEMMKKKNKT